VWIVDHDALPKPVLRMINSGRKQATEIDGVASALRNSKVAGQLRVSGKTVRNHLTTIFSDLGKSSRAQAMVSASDAGLGHD